MHLKCVFSIKTCLQVHVCESVGIIHACMYACRHVGVRSCVRVIHVSACSSVHIHMCDYMSVHIHMCDYMSVHIHVCDYMSVHELCMHVSTCVSACPSVHG